MAEITEIFDDATDGVKDIGKTIKKKFKEKPVFYTALIGVAGFALYKLFTTPSEYVEYVDESVQPNSYDGYPTLSDSMLEDYDSMLNGGGWYDSGGYGGGIIGGGSTSAGQTNGEGSSFVEDSYIYVEDDEYIRELEEQLFSLEEQLQMMYQYPQQQTTLHFTDDGEVYDLETGSLIYSDKQSYRVLLGDSEAAQVQQSLEKAANLKWRNQQLQQMQANSYAWSQATTQAEKDALHQANQTIAKGLGLTYNSGSGKWYEADGSEALIYSAGGTTPTGNKGTAIKTTKPDGTTYSGGVQYDASVDYAAKIAEAKASGASQSVIDQLTAQREAKKKGEGLDDYGNKIKTSGNAGTITVKSVTSKPASSSSSSSSSKTSSSSSSSSSGVKQGTVTGKVTWTKTKNKDGSTTHTAKDSSGNVKASYTTK